MKFREFVKEKRLILKIVLVLILCLADLLSKAFFASYFYSGGETINLIGDFLQLTYVENTGAAFGSFSDYTIILTISSAIFVVTFILLDILYFKYKSKLYIVGYTFVLAGALGNFIDRLFLNYVRDFIRVSMFDFVCNIADILITVGVVLYAISLIMANSNTKGEVNEQ